MTAVPSGGLTTTRLTVVAAVLVDGDRILACRRASGRDAAGRWEFPGGKVEPAEDPRAALAREIAEELGITIRAGALIDRSTTRVGHRLIDLSCFLVDTFDTRPVRSTDHDQLRWCLAEELAALPWADPDLPAVRRLTNAEGAGPADVS